MKKFLFIILSGLSMYSGDTSAQTQSAENSPSKTTSRTPVAEGKDVWGVFDGRVRCKEMAPLLKTTVNDNCEKLKWSFTFYYDPKTHEPTTYKLFGSLFREKSKVGKWTITKGTADNANASVIQLDPDKPETSLFFLTGDENVLFILNEKKELMVGDSYLSFTFNRTVN